MINKVFVPEHEKMMVPTQIFLSDLQPDSKLLQVRFGQILEDKMLPCDHRNVEHFRKWISWNQWNWCHCEAVEQKGWHDNPPDLVEASCQTNQPINQSTPAHQPTNQPTTKPTFLTNQATNQPAFVITEAIN